MGYLKRRSLHGLERLSDANAMDQHSPIEQVALAEPLEHGALPGELPQYDFPAPASGPMVSEKASAPGVSTEGLEQWSAAVATRQATDPVTPVPETDQIAQLTSALAPVVQVPVAPAVRTARQPLVIAGKAPRPPRTVPISPRKRRIIMSTTVVTMLAVILFGTLASVVAASDKGAHSSLFSPLVRLFNTNANNGNTIDIAAQLATVTPEVLQSDSTQNIPVDTGATTSSGQIGAPDDGNANRFAFGYCTYWANLRYHELTGHWVPWLGDAYQWADQAAAYGWVVSTTPNMNGPSILVMAPYTMGNGALGHVAVVERVNTGAGTVTVSQMNWGAQNWDVVTYMDVPYPTGGLVYVWYPG